MIKFTKYQAAGNAYIIIQKERLTLSANDARLICDPVFGCGGDGVICWEKTEQGAKVLIFNPDGSLAEKSGNGLRIFSDFYFESICPDQKQFTISCSNSLVKSTLQPNGLILLEMGRVVSQFEYKALAESNFFPNGMVLDTDLGSITGYPVDIGNPHFVVLMENVSADFAHRWGPLIENHPIFPNRTNVQFAEVVAPDKIQAEIWERGAGYTLSSGSSSCAIAAVAHQLGLCENQLGVYMPGGTLDIEIRSDKTVFLSGPVSKTVDGMFYPS